MTTRQQLKTAREQLSAARMIVSFTDYDEFRVNFLESNRESSAYYTNDVDDAIGTGKAMRAFKNAKTI